MKTFKDRKKIADHGATIVIGSQMSFQIEIGIGIAISISKQDWDRDRNFNFGDRGHALFITKQTNLQNVYVILHMLSSCFKQHLNSLR